MVYAKAEMMLKKVCAMAEMMKKKVMMTMIGGGKEAGDGEAKWGSFDSDAEKTLCKEEQRENLEFWR